MGLRSWWKDWRQRGDEEALAAAEDAKLESADEVAHSDIDEVRLDIGTGRLGAMDDARRYE
jgi:hypothetical protein